MPIIERSSLMATEKNVDTGAASVQPTEQEDPGYEKAREEGAPSHVYNPDPNKRGEPWEPEPKDAEHKKASDKK